MVHQHLQERLAGLHHIRRLVQLGQSEGHSIPVIGQSGARNSLLSAATLLHGVPQPDHGLHGNVL